MSLDISLKDPTATYESTLYEGNITHNLNKMAEAADIYEALWRPHRLRKDFKEGDYKAEWEYEDSVKIKAKEIIDIIEKGLKKLKDNPDYFRKFNSPNGWGVYEHFVPFVEDYLKALKEYPEAIIRVSR